MSRIESTLYFVVIRNVTVLLSMISTGQFGMRGSFRPKQRLRKISDSKNYRNGDASSALTEQID